MAGKQGSSARALAEPIGLDSRSFGDADLSALSLSNSAEQFGSNDFEEFANIQAELVCMNTEEVISTEDDAGAAELNTEMESAVSDVEMTDVSEETQAETTFAEQTSQNIIFQTKPSLQRVPMTTVQMKPSGGQAGQQSQSIMIVSPAGGQGTSQILKISHPASASAGQLQSLAQTLITAKSADGNIVQLRSAQSGKPLMSTGQGNITLGSLQTVKSVQSVKRPAQAGQQNRNVYTKMILSGNQAQGSGEVLIATSQGESQPQTIKFLSSNAGSQAIPSPTKTITLAQAQQMGLITSKVQHILPSSPQKQQVWIFLGDF